MCLPSAGSCAEGNAEQRIAQGWSPSSSSSSSSTSSGLIPALEMRAGVSHGGGISSAEAERQSKRSFCVICYKASTVCICSRFSKRVENRTAITILQHPKERFHPLGSARVALLGLSNVHLIVVPLGVGKHRVQPKIPGSKRSLRKNRWSRSRIQVEDATKSHSICSQKENPSVPNLVPELSTPPDSTASILDRESSENEDEDPMGLEIGGHMKYDECSDDDADGFFNLGNNHDRQSNVPEMHSSVESSTLVSKSDSNQEDGRELSSLVDQSDDLHSLILNEFSDLGIDSAHSPPSLTTDPLASDWYILSESNLVDEQCEESMDFPPWLPFQEGTALLYPSPQSTELPNLSNIKLHGIGSVSSSPSSSIPESLVEGNLHDAESGKNHVMNSSPLQSSDENGQHSNAVALPKHFIVLDGTWPKAKRIYHQNPWLKSIPHYRLPPIKPSSYGPIRKEPKQGCISTVEAIVYALKAIEPETDGLDTLLNVFDSMVEDQIRCMPKYNHVKSTRKNDY